jgi:DNA helicase-2/ATP-dependent DNA helicase PcrA
VARGLPAGAGERPLPVGALRPARRTGWSPRTSSRPPPAPRYEGSDAEERRLFYVALTPRPRRRLPVVLRPQGAAVPAVAVPARGRRRAARHWGAAAAGHRDGTPRSRNRQSPRSASRISPASTTAATRTGLARRSATSSPLAVELGYGKAIHHVLRQLAEVTRADGAVPGSEGLDALVDAEFLRPVRQRHRVRADAQGGLAAGRALRRRLPRRSRSRVGARAAVRAALSRRASSPGVPTSSSIARTACRRGSRSSTTRCQAIPAARSVTGCNSRSTRAAGRGEGLAVEAAYLHELREGARHPVDIGAGGNRRRGGAGSLAAGAGPRGRLPTAARARALRQLRLPGGSAGTRWSRD